MCYLRGSQWDSYTQRFAPDWHCDLMEQLSEYRACTAMGLNDMAHAIGLPGKLGGAAPRWTAWSSVARSTR